MITFEMLERFRLAKNKVIISLDNKEFTDTCIAIQEMYVECKALRRDNFKLLNQNDLLETALTFIESIRINNYLSDDQEEAYDKLYELTSEQNMEILNER